MRKTEIQSMIFKYFLISIFVIGCNTANRKIIKSTKRISHIDICEYHGNCSLTSLQSTEKTISGLEKACRSLNSINDCLKGQRFLEKYRMNLWNCKYGHAIHLYGEFDSPFIEKIISLEIGKSFIEIIRGSKNFISLNKKIRKMRGRRYIYELIVKKRLFLEKTKYNLGLISDAVKYVCLDGNDEYCFRGLKKYIGIPSIFSWAKSYLQKRCFVKHYSNYSKKYCYLLWENNLIQKDFAYSALYYAKGLRYKGYDVYAELKHYKNRYGLSSVPDIKNHKRLYGHNLAMKSSFDKCNSSDTVQDCYQLYLDRHYLEHENILKNNLLLSKACKNSCSVACDELSMVNSKGNKYLLLLKNSCLKGKNKNCRRYLKKMKELGKLKNAFNVIYQSCKKNVFTCMHWVYGKNRALKEMKNKICKSPRNLVLSSFLNKDCVRILR
jgi:hypothetical protein